MKKRFVIMVGLLVFSTLLSAVFALTMNRRLDKIIHRMKQPSYE